MLLTVEDCPMPTRILFADSDRPMLDLNERFFANNGFEVDSAANVASALAESASACPMRC